MDILQKLKTWITGKEEAKVEFFYNPESYDNDTHFFGEEIQTRLKRISIDDAAKNHQRRHGKIWSEFERDILREFSDEFKVDTLAKALGRTKAAVSTQIWAMENGKVN